MSHALGKIVSSESHVLYHVRVYDESESATPPPPAAYAFGRFVQLDAASPEHHPVVGVIVNSRLISPEGGHYGPRLTIPHDDNAVFAPDYLNEVGVMVAVLLLGQLRGDHGDHGVPSLVQPVGLEVRPLADADLLAFHRTAEQRFQLRYYALVQESGIPFASALLQQIVGLLAPLANPDEQRMLDVLRQNIAWQSTLGTLR